MGDNLAAVPDTLIPQVPVAPSPSFVTV